jgi:hypothetical protein
MIQESRLREVRIMVSVTPETSESLAGIPEGAEFEVVESRLPGGVATATPTRLRPGSRWRCRLNGRAIVLLHSQAGRMISLRSDEARYIQVRVLRGAATR